RHSQKAEPEHECQPAEAARRHWGALSDGGAREQRDQPQPNQQLYAPLRRIFGEQPIPDQGQPERRAHPRNNAAMAPRHSTLGLFWVAETRSTTPTIAKLISVDEPP